MWTQNLAGTHVGRCCWSSCFVVDRAVQLVGVLIKPGRLACCRSIDDGEEAEAGG